MPLRKLASLSRIEYASEIENISEIIAIKSISSNYREGNFNEYWWNDENYGWNKRE